MKFFIQNRCLVVLAIALGGTEMGGLDVEAESLEKVYKWLEASRVYGRALEKLPENEFTRKGEVQEKN